VETHHPVVRTLRDRMASLRPLGVSMSGTGPVLFALAAKETDARALGDALAAQEACEVFVTRTFAEER
jgi:4-diphosphocytidyl-2C-methyl-D-erythritol kinase